MDNITIEYLNTIVTVRKLSVNNNNITETRYILTTILPGISAGIFSWYFLRIYVESLNSFSLFSLELSPQTTDFLLVFWAHSKFLTHRSSPWCTSPPTCRHHNTISTHKFRLPHCSTSLSNSLPVKWFPQFFFDRHHRYILLHQSRGVGRWNNSDALPLWSSDE